MDWKNDYYVRLYGLYDFKKPWQENYNLSTNMAHFNAVESGVGLRQYQLDHWSEKVVNRFFQNLAKFRNRFIFYHLPIERTIYTFFREQYYKRRASKSQKNN